TPAKTESSTALCRRRPLCAGSNALVEIELAAAPRRAGPFGPAASQSSHTTALNASWRECPRKAESSLRAHLYHNDASQIADLVVTSSTEPLASSAPRTPIQLSVR